MIQQDESADLLQLNAEKTDEDKDFDALARKPGTESLVN